jgi:hypothetical protein
MRAQLALKDYRVTGFGGPVFYSGASPRPFLMGLSLDSNIYHAVSHDAGVGFLVEGGLYHPALSGTANYYGSVDAMVAGDGDGKMRAFGVAGYTRLFNATSTSIGSVNAFNLGVGMDRVLRDDLWLRVEVRDMYTAAANSHALAIRIGLVGRGSVE